MSTPRVSVVTPVYNGEKYPAKLTVVSCVISETAAGLGDNVFVADVRYSGNRAEPYALHFKSPAVGVADPAAYGKDAKDILGYPRLHEGKADAGAFAVHVESTRPKR